MVKQLHTISDYFWLLQFLDTYRSLNLRILFSSANVGSQNKSETFTVSSRIA